MARTLSGPAVRAVMAQDTAEVFLLLLTIAHATLADDIRLVCNTVDIVSRGQTYIGLPFEITLPSEQEDRVPQMRLRVDNVNREIVQAVRTMTSPATVTVEVILASSLDTVEASFAGFTLRAVTYDALVVEGTLALEDVLSEPYPEGTFTPNLFPAIFTWLVGVVLAGGWL